jgi:bla regulator protein blaR1
MLKTLFANIFYRTIKRKGFAKIRLIIILTIFSGLLVGCNQQKQWNSSGSDMAVEANELLKFKSQYVGDNSNTVGLIDALGMPQGVKRGEIELQTTVKPYAIIINCKIENNSELIKNNILDDTPFYRDAVILFSLIDNVDTVTIKQEVGVGNSSSMDYTRKWAQQSFNGSDVRSFAKNTADFETFLKKVQNIVRPDDVTASQQSSAVSQQIKFK